MEQETLIYIEEKDKHEATKLAGGFTIEETLTRAYINALGSELALKYLAQEEISVSNIYNLHNIHKIREEFDIADVMLPNIHIDVRMVYDENFIFIPKSHFEYNLIPDIYLVFKMLDDESCVKFLGFFEPKLINKNNHNDKYYFIEKEKLSHPSDLKSYVENFNGNTTEALSQEELENGQKLAMQLIDHDITESDKRDLIKLLLKSSALRENLIEFDNFEWISYHVATNEDLTALARSSEQTQDLPIADEFEIFEQTDEFSGNDSLTNEDDNTDNNFTDDLFNNLSDMSLEEGIEQDLSQDEPTDTESVESTNLAGEEVTENLTEDFSSEENFEDEPALELNENPVDIEEDSLLSDINPAENEETEDQVLENALPDESSFLDVEEPELTLDDTLPDLSDITDSTVEKIHLSEFNELPFDTGMNEQSTEEEVSTLDELDSLDSDMENLEDIPDMNIEEPVSETLTNFDTLGERDDIKPIEEIPFEDNEITSLENLDPVLENEEINIEENDAPQSTISFDNLELPQENSVDSEETTDELPSVVSLDDLTTPAAEDNTESLNAGNDNEQPLTLEELSAEIPETPASQEDATEDFLEALAEDTPQVVNDNINNNPVSYENSTPISSQNLTPGEFSIDINQPVDTADLKDNDIEKLEVLYNENNNYEEDANNLQFKTSLPEKGKKAIALATVVIAALASLLIYTSMNKSDNQVAEQNNTNVLEKNLPKLDEQEIPEQNSVLPEKTNGIPKLEDAANNAVKNAGKPKAPVIESPYLEVKKLSWSVPDYVSYNDEFRKYLQTAGKSLKLSLSSDLLLATEYAYSDQIQVNIVLSKEGTIQNANILQSSGSTQIDDIVLRTVNDTLKVVKAPAGVIVGDNIQLTLKIYL